MTQTALIVIDFINDIVNTQSQIASCAAHVKERGALHAANKAIAWARSQGHMVVQVKVGFDKSYHLQPEHSPIFGQAKAYDIFKLNTWGTDFHDELDVADSDLIIEKPRVNPFYATQLDAALRAKKIENLYVCGVSTCIAIQSIVRDGHDRDYRMNIIEDACAAANEKEHQNSIETLARLAKVTTSQELSN